MVKPINSASPNASLYGTTTDPMFSIANTKQIGIRQKQIAAGIHPLLKYFVNIRLSVVAI